MELNNWKDVPYRRIQRCHVSLYVGVIAKDQLKEKYYVNLVSESTPFDRVVKYLVQKNLVHRVHLFFENLN